MYKRELEELIDAVVADGQLTEREERVLTRKAEELGVDPEEVMVIVEGRLHKMRQSNPQMPPAPPAPAAAPRSQKVGKVSKCPVCGAVIQPGRMQCDACGYEIHGLGVVNSMKELDSRLRAKSKLYEAETVAAFPVPNNREDLIEFMITMKSRAGKFDQYTATKEERAYAMKYFECSEKAAVYFGQDAQFAPLLRESAAMKEKWEKKDMMAWWRKMDSDTRTTILVVGGMALMSLIGYIVAG